MTERTEEIKKVSVKIGLLLRRLLLVIAASLAALIFAEAALRIAGQPRFPKAHSDPVRFVFVNRQTEQGPFYVNKPGRITFQYDGNPRGYFAELNQVHHDVNPSGFRGPAFTPKPKGTFRMVFLGDSFTFGEGVHNQDTYPEAAARLLRKDGRRVEACNLGVGGYNTSQEADVLRIFGFDLQPDVVVLGYTLNDAEPPLFQVDPASGKPVRRDREALVKAEGSPGRPPASFLYRFRLAQAIWRSYQQRCFSKQAVDYYLSLYAPPSRGRIESERALRQIISECRDRKVPCIVVMFPMLYKLSHDYPFTAIHQQVGEVVRQAGGRFIDLLPVLKGMDAGKLMVHPTDQHPNEKVHAIAGRLVAEEVSRISAHQ